MASGDPCAALFGSMKTACENMGKTVSGNGGNGGSGLGGLLGYNKGFDFRHFMIRVAEFGIGALLVVVAADALIKQEVLPNPMIKSAKRMGKRALK